MWFRKKSQNRRFERGHILEVKLRSQHVRARRLRIFGEIVGFALVVPVIVIALWRTSQWMLDEWVFRNPAFAIREIQVQTDGVIPLHQIRLWAGVKTGDNLFALDLSRIERDLKLVPWIRQASVERVLPDLLKIRVSEREPIAQVSRFQGGSSENPIEYKVAYLDDEGYVMPALNFAQRGLAGAEQGALPVLTGIAGSEMRAGKRLELNQVHAALHLIEAFDRSPLVSAVDLKSVDVSSPEILVVTTHQQNEVSFATAALETQLRRWQTVHEYAQGASKVIATLDLSVTNNVPATWHQAGFSPPVVPKLPKTHTRRKHV